MSEAKFTKGPWRHDARNHQIRTGEATGKRFEGECIGSISPLCPEMQANAKLIAAAPELYEALTDFKGLFADDMPFVIARIGGGMTNGDQSAIDRVLIAVDAALAKATH